MNNWFTQRVVAIVCGASFSVVGQLGIEQWWLAALFYVPCFFIMDFYVWMKRNG